MGTLMTGWVKVAGLAKLRRPAGLCAKRLCASTLVETMIASVIFLCVFVISLETVSRLTIKESDGLVLVEADYRIKECFREYGDGRHENGRYIREYDWGTVTVLIRPYGDYAELQEVTITALIENILKRLEFKYIIETAGDIMVYTGDCLWPALSRTVAGGGV